MTSRPNRHQVAEQAQAWWTELQPGPGGSGDRGSLARLRRASTPVDAMAEEAALRLFRRFGLSAADAHRLPRVATIAMTLAHVRETDPVPVMRRVGRPSIDEADAATLKPIRLKRLLSASDDEELAREMRRLVGLADGKLDVGDLAASIFCWDDQVRTRWAFDYYAAGRAAPAPDDA